MILVTNRNIIQGKKVEKCFGDTFNAKGSDELRLAEVTRTKKKWKMVLAQEGNGGTLPSERIFLDLQKKMRRKKRNCIFFVHGFNNDLEDVLTRCHEFEKNFDVEVIAFTWPANGGSLLRGTTSYKSDKRDAKLSVNALDRCLEKLHSYLIKHEETACNQSFNLVLHSMGNYLKKSLMDSSVYQRDKLIFDNIIMAAADVNNDGHAEWVDQIAHRKRVYITINENDSALLASRMKFGDQQLARLGHYTQNLNSKNAVYLDFTDAKRVGSSHSYFEGNPLKNTHIKKAFRSMFNGEKVERAFKYEPHSRVYLIP
jgi:esterase/lipase superfamily enzyme